MDYRIIIFPFIGAVIGWFTNYIAVKMLFRPYKPVRILGFTFQGLIPKRRREIAQGIAKTIERDILSARDIASLLEGVDWEEEVERTVEEVVGERLKGGAFNKIPLMGIISENILYHLKYYLTKEIIDYLTKKKGSILDKFQKNIDLREMVVDRIDNLDLTRFENLLQNLMATELRHIEWIGGVIGFFIGVFQVIVYYLMR